MMNINMFSPGLDFGIFGEDNAGLIVSVGYTSIDWVYDS